MLETFVSSFSIFGDLKNSKYMLIKYGMKMCNLEVLYGER